MKENTTWQTVYKQLQEFLNECVKLWRLNKIFDKGVFVLEDWVYRNQWKLSMFSFHDLFSKDSQIMEFVEWEVTNETMDYLYHHKIWEDYKYITHKWEVYYHYMIMWDMTAEKKIQYFLSNAKLPTKSE